jgi:hypothetical protein
MIRSIEAYPDYLVAGNILELSAKSQVVDLPSNAGMALLIKSNSYKPVMLLDKAANVAVMNFLENESSRQFAVQGNTYLAEKLTAGPSLEDFMARTHEMFRTSLIDPFREICQDMKTGMVALRGDVQEVKSELTTIRQQTDQNSNSINILSKQIERITLTRRRGFKDSDVLLWIQVVIRHYGGKCPCCQETKIVDEHGFRIRDVSEKDHANGAHLNKKEDGWIICLSCHNKKTISGNFSKEWRPAFEVFQNRLSAMPNHQYFLPKVA